MVHPADSPDALCTDQVASLPPASATADHAGRSAGSRLSRSSIRSIATTAGLALITASLCMVGPAQAEAVPAPPRPVESSLDACTGSRPIVCHFDVDPGHYDVTVKLGSRTEDASTSVEVESRRLVVPETRTPAGEPLRRSFTVNVRAQEGQQNDFGSGKGSPGLTIAFEGDAPSVLGIGIAKAAPRTTRLFLLGDSTVTDQESAPYTGWGQRLPAHFRRGVSVVNHSGSGESTTSFLSDPRMWEAVREQLRPGDVALIQLAHNDKTISAEEYQDNLRTLVNGVRNAGAVPVLVTPIVRHRFDAEGQLTDVGLIATAAAGDLPQLMREVGAEEQVPVIDLTARSEALVEGLGPVDAEPLYLIRINGDRTHTSELGADAYAGIVAEELKELRLLPPQSWAPTVEGEQAMASELA